MHFQVGKRVCVRESEKEKEAKCTATKWDPGECISAASKLLSAVIAPPSSVGRFGLPPGVIISTFYSALVHFGSVFFSLGLFGSLHLMI